jgi:hypothetical protein
MWCNFFVEIIIIITILFEAAPGNKNMCEFDLCESEGVLEMGSLNCVVVLVLARGTRSFIYIPYV